MSTELAARTSAGDLAVFVQEAREVHKIAIALSTTAFVPAAMKGKPEEITGAILFGRELGLDPMMALQTINIIQGRPTLTANAMRGLAMAAGVEFRLDETTETRCVMSALSPGAAGWTTVSWTLDQARKLGLLSKENWKNQPGAMLIARATSQLCRLVAANVLIGAPYSTEEVRDLPVGEVPAEAPPVQQEQEPPPPVRALKVAPKYDPPAFAEPELIPDNDVPDYAAGDPKQIEEKPFNPAAKISASTRAAIMAEFTRANKRERTERLEIISQILGKEIGTVTDLTEGEARSILGVLKLDPEWPTVAEVPGE